MKNSYRLVLYLVVGLIILIGLLAFLFRQAIQDTLHGQIDQPIRPSIEEIKPTAKEVVDLEILKSANFLKLKNNIIYFNFLDICGRAAAQLTASSSGPAPRPARCLLGNSNPIIGQVKK